MGRRGPQFLRQQLSRTRRPPRPRSRALRRWVSTATAWPRSAICGTLDAHRTLERAIADSCTPEGPGPCSAPTRVSQSRIDGVRLEFAETRNSPTSTARSQHALIVTDVVFSMDGFADLGPICEVADRYDARSLTIAMPPCPGDPRHARRHRHLDPRQGAAASSSTDRWQRARVLQRARSGPGRRRDRIAEGDDLRTTHSAMTDAGFTLTQSSRAAAVRLEGVYATAFSFRRHDPPR